MLQAQHTNAMPALRLGRMAQRFRPVLAKRGDEEVFSGSRFGNNASYSAVAMPSGLSRYQQTVASPLAWLIAKCRRPRLPRLAVGRAVGLIASLLLHQEGVVEIESEWTAQKREQMGIVPKIKLKP